MNRKLQKMTTEVALFLLSLSACVSSLTRDGLSTGDPASALAQSPTIPTVTVTTTPILPTETVIPTSTPKPTLTPTLSPRQMSIQEMLAVVDIVEEYHSDFGSYPTSMDDLIPTYLDEPPFTNEGYEIYYRLDKVYIYVVGFRLRPEESAPGVIDLELTQFKGMLWVFGWASPPKYPQQQPNCVTSKIIVPT